MGQNILHWSVFYIIGKFLKCRYPKLSQPHFGQVWGWSPTLGKVGGLESSGTPECLELDSKAQNTLYWGVFSVIGKVLKRRYRKWPRIGNSDICSPSYGQKKGPGIKLAIWLPTTKSWESTSSRRRLEECDTTLGKLLTRATTLIQDSSRSEFGARSCGRPKSRIKWIPTRDSFGTPFQESQQNVPFGCSLCDQPQRIL
jgi:hypothetical protein